MPGLYILCVYTYMKKCSSANYDLGSNAKGDEAKVHNVIYMCACVCIYMCACAF